MNDPIAVLAMAVVPLGLLGLASLSKSFRLVLKSIFTDTNSSSILERLPDGDVLLSTPPAPYRRSGDTKRERAAHLAARRRRLDEEVAQLIATKALPTEAMLRSYSGVYTTVAEALANAATGAVRDVTITIHGARSEEGVLEETVRKEYAESDRDALLKEIGKLKSSGDVLKEKSE